MPENLMNDRPNRPDKRKNEIAIIVIVAVVCAVLFGAIGYVVGNKKTITPVLPVEPTITNDQSSPVAEETATADVTADWKIYTNDTYGFSFKYPKDWILGPIDWQDEMVAKINLTSPEMQEFIKEERPDASPDIYIKIVIKPENFSLKEFIENDENYIKDSISKHAVAEYDGYEATFGGMVDEYSVFWENGNYYFEASTFGPIEDLDNILETFQFTK